MMTMDQFVSMTEEARLTRAKEFRNRLERVKKEQFARLQTAFAWLWGDSKNPAGNVAHPAFKDQCDKYNDLDFIVKRLDIWHVFCLMWRYVDIVHEIHIVMAGTGEVVMVNREPSDEFVLPEELAELMLLAEGIDILDHRYDSKAEL